MKNQTRQEKDNTHAKSNACVSAFKKCVLIGTFTVNASLLCFVRTVFTQMFSTLLKILLSKFYNSWKFCIVNFKLSSKLINFQTLHHSCKRINVDKFSNGCKSCNSPSTCLNVRLRCQVRVDEGIFTSERWKFSVFRPAPYDFSVFPAWVGIFFRLSGRSRNFFPAFRPEP